MDKNELQRMLKNHRLWLSNDGGKRADLIGADLCRANLIGANLIGANLTDANLIGANLTDANLIGANLTDANLIGANLRGANLRGAILNDADLRRANLIDANLDEMYSDIPVTLAEVRDVILSRRERLDMRFWHDDSDWHNGTAKPIDECCTSHCIAGWAHHLASLKRPELLDPKVNIYLVGRLALGVEVANRFYDDSESVLKWLEGLECGQDS